MTDTTDTTKVQADEAKCLMCGNTATHLPVGWLFSCRGCDYGWGHPQLNSRRWAADCLRMARANDSSRRLP